MTDQYCKVKRVYSRSVPDHTCESDKGELCEPQPSRFGGALETCTFCAKTK